MKDACRAALVALPLAGCTFDLHEVVSADAGAGRSVDACNLTTNPSFEQDTSFWVGSGALLERASVPDAVEGESVVRVRRDPGDATLFAIRDEPPSVSSSVAGAQYRATAWVRSAIDPPNAAATVRLHLRGGPSLDQLASSEDVPLTAAFQELSIAGIAISDGDAIDVHLTQYQAEEGDAFYVDLVQLVRLPGADGGACP